MFKSRIVDGDKKLMSSGPLMLLKSFMGQEAVDNIQKLAGNGTFEKIVKFVDDIEEHNRLLAKLVKPRDVFVCSNPLCDAVWNFDPKGHCPKCLQSSGVGWSTMQRRLLNEPETDAPASARSQSQSHE